AVAALPDGRIIAGASTGYINIRTISGTWIAVSDIVRATQLPRKGITCIIPHEGLLYIGTEFGVAIYDPDRSEFGDTYRKFGALASQTPANDVLLYGNEIWVATETGLAVADLRSTNLKDPANWTSFSTFPGTSA